MHTKEYQKEPGFTRETCFIGKGAPERCALSILGTWNLGVIEHWSTGGTG